MARLIAIDPGVRLCGYAVFQIQSRALLETGIVRSDLDRVAERALVMAAQFRTIIAADAPHVVIEFPVVYPTKSKGDANDIVELAFVAGAVAAACGGMAVTAPQPRQWKGTLPKKIHHDRIRAEFPAAIPIVEACAPKSMQHHVWDAVGLGLWRLGK